LTPTFHGRDVFAPTAGRLAMGAVPSDAGPRVETMTELAPPVVARRPGRVEGRVIHVDAFGNLITSLGAEHVPAEASIEVEGTGGVYHPVLARTFSDVAAGALVAYVGSGGQLEIARRNGSAALHVGAERGSIVRVGAS
jgi:S-adenosylmethionine hydrolase